MFFLSYLLLSFSTFYNERDHRKCEIMLCGWHCGLILFKLWRPLSHRIQNQVSCMTCILHRPECSRYTTMALARIQEWYNHWCMILNPNKTKALVVSRSRTVSPPHDDLVLSVVSIRAIPNLDILGKKFDSKLTIVDHAHCNDRNSSNKSRSH